MIGRARSSRPARSEMLAGPMTDFDRVTLRRPDDWHLHVRDGAVLRAVIGATSRRFGRAIIMPNLVPPVTDRARARRYRDAILAALPAGADFEPLMTCYLTDRTDADDLAVGAAEGLFTAAKLYPAHATTHSADGVTDIAALVPVFERMQAIDLPLLVHGEVTDPDIDIFDRETVFIDRVLAPLRSRYPALRIVFEHVSTQAAVAFVRSHAGDGRTAATVTAHHLQTNRNALFVGGLRPHNYCLPVVKTEADRLALVEAATSGDPYFFLGTDSAPHPQGRKESACCAAGVFSAPTALELYAEVFEAAGALDRLEAFASLNGPRFYGLPVNQAQLTLERAPTPVPDRIETEDGTVLVPFRAGETLTWRLS